MSNRPVGGGGMPGSGSAERAAVLQRHASATPAGTFAPPPPARYGNVRGAAAGVGLLPGGVGAAGVLPLGSSGAVGPVPQRQPPPLPPRTAAGTLSSWGNSWSPYGAATGYGGYPGLSTPGGLYNSLYSRYPGTGGLYNSPLNRYGMYGGNTGLLGMQQYQGNNGTVLTETAVENSRPAFEAILSVIHAFGSVSMMLESMFDAVYSSFRAVLGTADQFHQMKTTFTDIYTSFALFRLLRYLYRKLLILLKIRKPEDVADDMGAWSEASASSAMAAGAGIGADENGYPKKSHWPVIIFMSIAVGGPYLVYKFLSHFISSTEDVGKDLRENAGSIVLRALYDFQAQRRDELSFKVGDILLVSPNQLRSPQQNGVNPWVKALLCHNGLMGLIPTNYVTAIGPNNAATHQKISDSMQLQTLGAQWNSHQQQQQQTQTQAQPQRMEESGNVPSSGKVEGQNEEEGVSN